MADAHPPLDTLVQEIDASRWLVGKNIALALESRSGPGPSWSDGAGSFYNITIGSDAISTARHLPACSQIQKVYDAGGVSAVWAIGEAFCKLKRISPAATREHVTIAHLRSHFSDLSFQIPKVYYYTEFDGVYCIFLSKISGMTLSDAWPGMKGVAKDQIVSRIAEICAELGKWESDVISGVDGNHLSEQYLLQRDNHDSSPEQLLLVSQHLGMNCSTFMFYHCDLGPGNILVDDSGILVGIIDWETAGFVPKEWIRTKFRLSGGMDLPGDDMSLRTDWRKRVQLQLGTQGYPDVAAQWMSWRSVP